MKLKKSKFPSCHCCNLALLIGSEHVGFPFQSKDKIHCHIQLFDLLICFIYLIYFALHSEMFPLFRNYKLKVAQGGSAYAEAERYIPAEASLFHIQFAIFPD